MLHRRWFPDHIDGDLVVLRRHTRENLRDFLRWYQDPEVARLTRYQDGPMRPDEIERFFMIRGMGPDAMAMGIHVRATDRLIGTCAFSQLDADNGSVLFHITIGEHDAWGKGYGSEATRLMVDHALGTLGLHRVALSVFEFNVRAIRAYERVGFTTEGRAREAIWRDGRWWDELHMSVLEPDWRAARWRERAAADGRPIPDATPPINGRRSAAGRGRRGDGSAAGTGELVGDGSTAGTGEPGNDRGRADDGSPVGDGIRGPLRGTPIGPRGGG